MFRVKRCPCGSDGPFGVDRARPDGLTTRCRACRTASSWRYRNNGPVPKPTGPRRCRCGSFGPFGKNSGGKPHSLCKACIAKKTREWVKKHPKRAKAAVQAWWLNRANARQLRKCYADRFDTRHPGRRLRHQRDWAAANPEKVRARNSRWSRAHPIEGRLNAHRRRLREIRAPGTFTRDEWLETLDIFGHLCAYCLRPEDGSNARKLTIEHVIPLDRGGEHSPDNIVPACLSCNSAKMNRPIWYMLNREVAA
jgi:5-methylcytosine-specific restriction endonuclease McrA